MTDSAARPLRGPRRLALTLAALLVPGLTLAQTGTVTGLVTDARTSEPLPAVNVVVEGTTTGTSTSVAGTYTLTVEPGTYTLVASFLGYENARQEITVTAGGETEANFEMGTDDLQLSEVVVTGSGGLPVTKLRLGNSIGIIDGREAEELALPDITSLLQSRTPGVQILSSSGSAGTSSLIQLRGIGSLSGDSSPLLYVDGVRVTNISSFDVGTIDGNGGQAVSTLNLINPLDIERVEVLKGASAATVYGSDAANGVIQIFTKSGGSVGVVRPLSLTYQSGITAYDWSPYYDQIPDAAEQYLSTGSNIGTIQQLGASASGERFALYSGVTYREENTGNRYSGQDYLDARSNFTYAPDEASKLRIGASYTRDDVVRPDADNAGRQFSGWRSALLKPDGPDAIGFFETARNPFSGEQLYSAEVLERVNNEYSNRRYGGNIAYSRQLPLGLRLTSNLGFEDLALEQLRYIEQGFVTDDDGFRSVDVTDVTSFGGQATLGASRDLTADVDVDVAVGVDYYRQNIAFANVRAGSFDPAFDGSVAFGDETTFGLSEQERTFATGAVFGQTQFNAYDRLFVTLGLRGDRSSSFGSEAGVRLYPKVSAAYLLPFADRVPGLSTFKLRGSLGQAGRQPSPSAADISLRRLSNLDGQPAIIVDRPGEPDLQPSRTTELELGSDLSFAGGRFGLEGTYYYQRIKDDLYNVLTKPSDGFGNREQTLNVGEIRASGFEVSVFASPVTTPTVSYYTRVNASTVDTEVIDDGGFPFSGGPFNSLRYVRVEEGQPVGVFFYGQREFDEFGRVSTGDPDYYGNILPNFTGNWFHGLTLFGRASVTANLGWATGFKLLNFTRVNMIRNGVFDDDFTEAEFTAGREALAVSPTDRSADQIAAVTKYERFTESLSPEFLESGDFLKLRELAFSYRVPERYVGGFGIEGLSLTASATNVFTITGYKGFDPEVSVGGGNVFLRGADNRSIPPARRFVFKATVQF